MFIEREIARYLLGLSWDNGPIKVIDMLDKLNLTGKATNNKVLRVAKILGIQTRFYGDVLWII